MNTDQAGALAQYSDEELVSRRETIGSHGPHAAGSNGRRLMDEITAELRQRRLARRLRPPAREKQP